MDVISSSVRIIKKKQLDYGHHHPKFDFDEQALINGSALMAAAAADILK